MTRLQKTFSGANRPDSIDRFRVCGDLTISVVTNPQGDYWLSLTDEDDLLLSVDCTSEEEATGILNELGDEITIDWIYSYGFEY